MRIIPAIDLIDGKCVRLTQGDYEQKTVYNHDPIEVARGFETAGIKYLHLVDLDGAKIGKVTNWEVIESICKETELQVDFGGGIKTTAEIAKLLKLGVKQVNLGSIAVKQPSLVEEWVAEFGNDKIILSADVKENNIAINGWTEDAGLDIFEFIKAYQKRGIKYITCTDINTDGMLTGPNQSLYKTLTAQFPDLKIIASGGVGSIHDIISLRETLVDGVIVGKAIYEGKIALENLIEKTDVD